MKLLENMLCSILLHIWPQIILGPYSSRVKLVLPRRGCKTIVMCVCACVRACACMFVYIFSMKFFFLYNRLSNRHESLNKGGTPHGEYSVDNSDIIGRMVWQPFCIEGKIWTSPKLFDEKNIKLDICHQLRMGYRV